MTVNGELKKLTKDEAVRYHRLFWNRIAEETERMRINDPELLKSFVLKKYFPEIDHVYSRCFLCDYTHYGFTTGSDCDDHCPLFNPEDDCVSCLNGKYGEFISAIRNFNFKSACQIAKNIANIKERTI